jgi:hypothetical protein
MTAFSAPSRKTLNFASLRKRRQPSRNLSLKDYTYGDRRFGISLNAIMTTQLNTPSQSIVEFLLLEHFYTILWSSRGYNY